MGLGAFQDNETYIRGIFESFDKDGSGAIDQSEIGMVMRVCGKNPSDSDIREMLNEIDQDQDGTVNYEEFLRLIRKI